MAIQDIVVLALLLVGFLIGLTQSAFKKLFRLLIVILVVVIIYYAAVPTLSDWICNEALKVFGQTIEVTLEDGTVILATSILEIFEAFEAYGVDINLLSATAVGLCEMLSFIVLMIIALPVSLLISGLLWHLLFKRFLPEKLRKRGKISHLIGALIGGLEWLIIIVLFAIALAEFSTPIEETLITAYTDPSSQFYGILDGTNYEVYVKTFQEYITYISPTSDSAVILPGLLNMLEGMNINYLGMFKITYTYDTDSTVEMTLSEGLSKMFTETLDFIATAL